MTKLSAKNWSKAVGAFRRMAALAIVSLSCAVVTPAK
jgi:hypothetical protein